ncbi:MAG: sulfatase-like hydrolase/transferase, partial [Verrucomicrobia bacterium]|nr:sulfatase-like hydrolase/transferase [Verrucomicrobiota bacterium]
MRDGRLLIPAVLLLGLVAVLHAAKPNILFIITDDQAPDAIGAWGNNGIQTPNMDRLAAGGCSFTHTFNMGAWHGAVCMASRKMLNTGLFLWHAKSDNLDERVESRRMWSQLMHDAGYETYFAGKWHVLTDAENIFDHTGHVRPGMPNQTPAGYNRPKIGEEDQWQPWDKSRGGYWKGGR